MYLLRDFIEPGVTLASPLLQPIVREVVAAASKRALDQLTGQAGAAAVALCVETSGKLLLDAALARDAASAVDIAIRLASMSTRFGLTKAGSLAVILEEGAQNELRVPEADFWFRARRALDGPQQHRRAEAQRLVERASLSNLALRAAVAFVMPELPLWREEQTAEVHANLSFLNPAVGDLYLLGLLREESWATTGPKWPPTRKAMQQVPAPLLPLALALIGDQKALSKLTKALEAQAAAEDLDTLINAPLDEDHVLMTWARATPRAAATRKAIARMLSSSPVDRAFLKTLITSWLVSAPQMAVEDPVAKQLRAEAFFDLPPAPLRDDLEQPGQKRPRWPSWLDETRLPGLALRDGRAKLDGEAVRAVVALAQRATLDDAAALLKATSDVKPEALSAIASTVFVSWLGASGPPKEKWAMELLAHFPSDAWVAVLGARCEEWARGSFSARAKLGVEVLARMTSRAALLEVQRLSIKVRTKSLRERAAQVFEQAAKRLELSRDELDDRLVPDFGLVNGRTLSGGVSIDLDADLKPVLLRDGAPIKNLSSKAPPQDEHAWAQVKKGAKQLALAAHRLEQAMLEGRTLPAEHFSEAWLMHPLLSRIAERVIWGAFEGPKRTVFLCGPLRAFGSRSFAFEPSMRVRPLHPLELSAKERAWLVGAIAHPAFPQLERLAQSLEPSQLRAALRQHVRREVPSTRLLGLERDGWSRGTPVGRGTYTTVTRTGPGWAVELQFEPGIYLGDPRLNPDQTIDGLSIDGVEQISLVMRSELALSLDRALGR